TGLMLAMIGAFIWFSSRRLVQGRPEDDVYAEVADGAGDIGFFSPNSYWPLALAASATVAVIAVALWLVWLLVIALMLLFLALLGCLFEDQRPHATHRAHASHCAGRVATEPQPDYSSTPARAWASRIGSRRAVARAARGRT